MNRPRVVLVSLLALIVLAGCVGGPPSGSPEADRPSDTGGSSASDGAQWQPFAFTAGEYYQYRVTDHANDASAVITWEVLSVDGGEATAEVTYTEGGPTFDRTITAPKESMILFVAGSGGGEATEDAMVEARDHLIAGPFHTMLPLHFAHRALVVGDSWNAAGSADTGYATANVEGRDSYAGQDCYVTSYRVPDNGQWPEDAREYEFCIAPEASLPLATVVTDDATDEVTFEIVLEEYRRG